MHELSIAEALLGVLKETARKANVRRIRRVRLEVGALSSIVPESLELCFEIVAQGSIAERAILEITTEPGMGRCLECAKEFEMIEFAVPCPECGNYKVELLSGTELRVIDMEV